MSAGSGATLGACAGLAPEPAPRRWTLESADRRTLGMVTVASGLVFAALAFVMVREASTLGYPVARILFEDQFNSIGDGHLLPRDGEAVPPGLATLFMAPLWWLRTMAYYPLAQLMGSTSAITCERLIGLLIYLLGTPLVYRLLRCGNADRLVSVILAAAYALSPFALTRILLCVSLPAAPFLLWSELGRIEGRPRKRAVGLIAATFSYPMSGFSAVMLALQDYLGSTRLQRHSNRRILFATAGALAVVVFGVLGLWNPGHPESNEMHVGLRTFADMFDYPVFPFKLGPFWTEPVKVFETAVFMAGACVFLLTRPLLWAPLIVDLIYYVATQGGVRDHSMPLSTIGLFTIVGVRASLFEGGVSWRNRALVAGALFATVYGHAVGGWSGFGALAFAPAPPRPHLADIGVCVPPGQRRCVVLPSLYPGFVGRCEEVTTYKPTDLEDLRIEDPATIVFVAPSRLVNDDAKGGAYEGDSNETVLRALTAKIRAGQVHASVCAPWFVLVRSANSAPNDPSAADWLEHPSL